MVTFDMDQKVSLLSEETLDLCSSFDSHSESELSFMMRTPSVSYSCGKTDNQIENEDFSSSANSFQFTKDYFGKNEMELLSLNNFDSSLPKSNCSNGFSSITTLENSSSSIGNMFHSLPSKNEQLPSPKIKEYKKVLSETNEAYLSFLLSKFVLDSYKTLKQEISPDLGKKVEEVITSSKVAKLSVLRSKKGENLCLLGLDKNVVNDFSKGSLSCLEKSVLNQQALEVLRSTSHRLSSQQQVLRDMFGAHCQKVVQPDSLVCEERERLAGLHDCVLYQLDQSCQLLVSSSQLMQELDHMLPAAKQDLAAAAFDLIRSKAEYLQGCTSILRLKLEGKLYKDKSQTKAFNTVGDELKTSVDALREELKSLKKKLAEYEKKEETSRIYKELVADYGKIKRQLHHNYQTLSVLNDPDVSF